MKDLQKIFEDCLAELASIGITPEPITDVSVNSRAKKRWGQASRNNARGTWSISISDRLLDDSVPDEAARNTMIHEILHCVDGCTGHTGKWKALADICNEKLGTRIRRCSDYSDMTSCKDVLYPEGKYVFRCKKCGQIVTRMKRSKFVDNYTRYACGKCRGRFERIV